MPASPKTYTLRVLHLSDLHERVAPSTQGTAREWKVRADKPMRARVLGKELMEQLDKIVAAGPVDLLFFTGDLADWGLDGEYDLAKKRLGEIVTRVGLTWAQVFFVPGNHDVNRNEESQRFAQLRRFADENPDKIGAVMAGYGNYQGVPEEPLSVVAARQAGHHELLRRIERESLIPGPNSAHPSLGYRQQVQVRDLPFPVHIIGLDTAWLAGGDDDAGKLRLTHQQIGAHTTDEGELLPGLRLALMHHPLTDLADHTSARRLLAATVDLVTHGHQHMPGFVETTDPDRRLAVLAAGCLYEGDVGDRWVNRFHVLNVETNPEGQPLRYRVEFFAWSENKTCWDVDSDLYRNAPLGRLVWETPRGQAQPRPDDTNPPPDDALAKFVGRAEQLAALAAALLPPSGQAQAAVVCNLQGMAGVGKSFLIERFYDEHRTSFPGRHLKIPLGHDAAPTADVLLIDLAERLGVLQGPGRVDDRVRGAALAARPLLHIDNLDHEAQAESAAALVRRLPGVPIVLSGRYHFGRATPGWWLVPVAPFSVSDALAQLQAELVAEVAVRVEAAARHTLVGALGGLPLAIHLAASYLNAGYEVRDFLAALEDSGLSLTPFTASDTAYFDRAERALHATFELSLKALRVELGAEADAGLRAVAALGVAPLTGVGRSWLEAIGGAPSGKVIRWVSLAVKLSIVQHDLAAGRWRVHKLLADHLRGLTNADAEAATARMDAWVRERLPKTPDDTRGVRWGALQAEHDAVAEWVTGLDGERAMVGVSVGLEYALRIGPYAAWLGAVARGLAAASDAEVRSTLLWCQGNLALQAGDLELAIHAAQMKAECCAAQGWDRGVALAAGLRADVLEAGGQLDEALRIRREDELPVYERLGDVHSKASTMGRIADVLQVRGQLDEALRIRREEELPVYERLGDMQSKASTMGKITDVLQTRGQLDEVLRIRKNEVLPAFEQLGDIHGQAVTKGKIAEVLQAWGQLDEALHIWRDEVLPVFEQLGHVREKASAMGKIADVLQAQEQLDEALRLRRVEELPVYERLGEVREMAITMSKIADILEAQRQHDEALRLWREEVLPVFERLGDVRSKAVTVGKIADVLWARGQRDEAWRIYRDEVLPVCEALGDRRELLVNQAKLAITLLLTRKLKHRDEARSLLITALKSAVELNYPVEAAQIRSFFHRFNLRLPT
jgi:3',5'-cyclic AMP phosphodiesterase CpdA/tetratricopeptide (TPR) repeat protein